MMKAVMMMIINSVMVMFIESMTVITGTGNNSKNQTKIMFLVFSSYIIYIYIYIPEVSSDLNF